MTKQNLQKELLEKVKPGTKPSDLKRSKSAENLLTPPAPPLARSKSAEPFSDPKYPYTTLISQQQELETLRKETVAKSETIRLLRKRAESLETELIQVCETFTSQLTSLTRLQSLEAENQTLKEQIATLTNHATDLDLKARHQNLKAWFSSYQQKQQLDRELAENIDQASTELISQDQTISQLRGELRKLKQTNQSLTKDLELAQRAVAWRKSPLPLPSTPSPGTFYALTFCLIGTVLWLTIR